MAELEQINKVMANLKDNQVAKENGFIFNETLADVRNALQEASPATVQKIDSIVQGNLPVLKNYKDGKDNIAYADFLDGIKKYVNAAPKNTTETVASKEELSDEEQITAQVKKDFQYLPFLRK